MVRAADFAELDAAAVARWHNYGQTDDVVFPVLLGLRVEEVRVDYKPYIVEPGDALETALRDESSGFVSVEPQLSTAHAYVRRTMRDGR
jgi:hypothetical protein